MFENDSEQIHQMTSKLVSTNIIDIIGETELPKRSLMFRYDFSFNKNKYNPFEYNYLYFRKIGVLEKRNLVTNKRIKFDKILMKKI
jgi:hypothetical protein